MNKEDIYVIYGTDYARMTHEILDRMQVLKKLKPDMKIGIKPNLVVAKQAGSGATTSPVIVEAVIRFLHDHGCSNIAIMEGSWVGDDTKRAYRVCGYQQLSSRYGVPLYDLKEDDYVVRRLGDLSLKVCKKPLAVDFLINIPVLKAHCQTLLTCALKNMKGCIPDVEKRRFHQLGLHKPIGYLSALLKPDLVIVDAIAGDLTFEEGGNPVQMDRIIAGTDPVLLDTYAASLLGYTPEDIAYIGIAEAAGAGSARLEQANIHEFDIGLKTAGCFKPSDKARRLAKYVAAEDACSACYGSLIHALQRLSERGDLSRLKLPVHIGQGFRGKQASGLGIGQCTRGCARHLPGCPPTARAIVGFLTEHLAGSSQAKLK